MAHYRRRDSREEKIGRVVAEDRSYDVDLVAKRATGVRGYRMTLVYVETDGGDTSFVELDPANSREEVQRVAAELRRDSAKLVDLLAGTRAGNN